MKIARHTGAFVVALLLLGLVTALSAAGAASGGPANPHNALLRKADREGSVKVIIGLENRAQQPSVIRRAVGRGADLQVRYTAFPLLAMDVTPAALAELVASPEVVSITEDKPQPPALNSTIPVINADDVLNLGFDGAGHTVAILDTGIDDDHPFFGSRIVSQACYSDGGDDGNANSLTLCADGTRNTTAAGSADVDGVANCLNGTTNICDHGSHVAGIAAGDGTGVSGAPAGGVARGSNVIAIQVFTRFNQATACNPNPAPCVLAYVSDQILGLQRVLALDGTFTIDSANISISDAANNTAACDGDGRKTPIDNLLAAGIATVVAAGNQGHPAGVGSPGCISTAVTVGATEDDDDIATFSNRGSLLDLFAPGDGVVSSEPDDVFGSKNGTSMASPHVAGAFAVLRDAYPSATIATLLGYMQSTGVSITYASGGSNVTTPRLNLLAALQAGNTPPAIAATNASVTVNEGATATNTGTFSDPEGLAVTLSTSRGTVTDTGGGNWSWSFGTNDGPTQSGPVTITATDDKAESSSVTFNLTVDNVSPSVLVDANQDTSINEGDTVNALFGFTDPGWADTYSSLFTFGGFAGTVAGTTTVTTQGPPQDVGTAAASRQYGDDGTFSVSASVTDDDGGSDSDSFNLSVANLAPTATINLAGTTLINGVPTFIANEGVPVPFSGRSTDAGSDDLRLTWSWGDGAPAPDVSTLYLNASGINPDPDPSPSVNPRDVTDNQPHAFSNACFYTVVFDALDDDNGDAADASVAVIIGGNASLQRGAGYWQTQYRPRPTSFSETRRQCYLAITRHMSSVFSEVRALNTVAQAFDVMNVSQNSGTALQKLDRELLAAWLNFANGAFGYGELVDTNGDGTADTAFSAVMATAEAVRTNPASTEAQLLAQRDILLRINGA